jgi:O-antigen/teichoic acid export membrane protein
MPGWMIYVVESMELEFQPVFSLVIFVSCACFAVKFLLIYWRIFGALIAKVCSVIVYCLCFVGEKRN